MKISYLTLLVLFSLSQISYSQNSIKKDITKLNGIWIAESYYNDFEKTNSAITSKHSFFHSYPVGLRMNSKEIKNEILNIGYSMLHDHSLNPEISNYKVINNDTIREHRFEINLKRADSLQYYHISNTHYFNFNCKAYIHWDTKNYDWVELYRPKTSQQKAETIRYKRVTNTFSEDYPYPNPIYHYTRNKILVGTYQLKNRHNEIIAEHYTIKNNGHGIGYPPLDHKVFYFSTDVYCGPSSPYDHVIYCDYHPNPESPDSSCDVKVIKIINDNEFHLINYVNTSTEKSEFTTILKGIVYKFIRKDKIQ